MALKDLAVVTTFWRDKKATETMENVQRSMKVGGLFKAFLPEQFQKCAMQRKKMAGAKLIKFMFFVKHLMSALDKQ